MRKLFGLLLVLTLLVGVSNAGVTKVAYKGTKKVVKVTYKACKKTAVVAKKVLY